MNSIACLSLLGWVADLTFNIKLLYVRCIELKCNAAGCVELPKVCHTSSTLRHCVDHEPHVLPFSFWGVWQSWYCTISINSAVMCHGDPLTAKIHHDVTVILARHQKPFWNLKKPPKFAKKIPEHNYCIYIAFQWILTENLLSHVGKGEGEPWWSNFQTKYLGNGLFPCCYLRYSLKQMAKLCILSDEWLGQGPRLGYLLKKKPMSQWIYQPAEIKISAGPSCITGPAELIEMLQYILLAKSWLTFL